jgi:hypothetical protein
LSRDIESIHPIRYTIGGNSFTTAQVGTLDGRVGFNSAAPYVGVGWGLDIGTMFEGNPKVTLTSTGGTESANPILTSSLKTEEKKHKNDIDFLRIYPVVEFAVLYRF